MSASSPNSSLSAVPPAFAPPPPSQLLSPPPIQAQSPSRTDSTPPSSSSQSPPTLSPPPPPAPPSNSTAPPTSSQSPLPLSPAPSDSTASPPPSLSPPPPSISTAPPSSTSSLPPPPRIPTAPPPSSSASQPPQSSPPFISTASPPSSPSSPPPQPPMASPPPPRIPTAPPPSSPSSPPPQSPPPFISTASPPPSPSSPPPQPPMASPPPPQSPPAANSTAPSPSSTSLPPPTTATPPLQASNPPPPLQPTNTPQSSPPPPAANPPTSAPPPSSPCPPAGSAPPASSSPPPSPSPRATSPSPPSNPPVNASAPPTHQSPPRSPPPPPVTASPPQTSPPASTSAPPPTPTPPTTNSTPPVFTPPPESPPSSNLPSPSPPPPTRIVPSPPSNVSPPSPSSQFPVPPSTTSTNNDSSSNSASGNGGLGAGGVVAIGVALGLVLLGVIGVVAWCLRKQKKRTPGLSGVSVIPTSQGSSLGSDSTLPKVQTSAGQSGVGFAKAFVHSPAEPGGLGNSRAWFTYEELLEATNGFSTHNLLGEGGFGCVYKGQLPDGTEVAVKQLKIGGGQGEREFKAEVETISRIHHRHLVSLVGYCISENRRLLIYEYVSNNTLYFHLHGEDRPVMDWGTRVKVAAGAARGIAYLHEDCQPRIIHRDIKSSNILLDNNFEARVSDFGLAKLALDTNSHITTRVIGTFGYMAPEYASSGKLTEKSDVFSFGVVLLELITGRKPVDSSQPLGDESLVEWARPLLSHALDTEELGGLADPRLEKNYVEMEMFRMIKAAAACVRHSAANRPRMGQVVRAFESMAAADLSNGMRVGESQLYDSAQQSAEIGLFRRMAFGTQDYSTEFFSQGSWNV